MKVKIHVMGLGLLTFGCIMGWAEEAGLAHLKSPSGKIEVVFEPVDAKQTPTLYRQSPESPSGQSTQYLITFYVAGASLPVTNDWYTDADPPKSSSAIFLNFLWSPQEDYVVITHGQEARHAYRWI